ncbi:MAG: hypothetical protein GY857_02060 [Desulfobacula sp.]|nr:hypothetical protein [Desulfobacula sp.]
MDKHSFSQSLWNIANMITGFAVAQTATFTYACANDKFGNMINTFGIKITLAASMTLITAVLSYIVWWCSKKQIIILQLHDKQECLTRIDLETIKIIRQAAYGRILLIILLLIPTLLALYARQLGHLPYN